MICAKRPNALSKRLRVPAGEDKTKIIDSEGVFVSGRGCLFKSASIHAPLMQYSATSLSSQVNLNLSCTNETTCHSKTVYACCPAECLQGPVFYSLK